MAMTIDSVIRWWGRERTDEIAIVESGDRLTWGQLNAWVGRVAVHFAAHGLEIGDRVCIFSANSQEWLVTALATLRCGGVFAGLNAKMVPAEIEFLLGDYAPVILMADAEGAGKFAGVGPLASRRGEAVGPPVLISSEEIAQLRQGAPADIQREVDPDACCSIITTSGSTARPKGVMFSNHSILDHVAAFILEDPVEPFPGMYIVAPLSTTAGGTLTLHSLIQGGTAYLDNKFDPAEVLKTVVEERIALFSAAPIFLQRIRDVPGFDEADLSCVKVSYTGGMAVPPPLLKAYADKGMIVRQMYGQSEFGGWGVTNPRRYALTHPDKCGYNSPTREVRIIDDAGNVLPHGEVGEIEGRGPGMMLGYWNNPEATAATLVNGWLRTGDLGVIDELGLLKFIDRKKDIIISGGLNISAAEIERVVLDHPGVEEVALIAAPDEKFGETPYAIVYSSQPVSIQDLIAHCNSQLSGYKVPRYVMVRTDPLPRLATGKISKPALREVYLKQPLPDRVR